MVEYFNELKGGSATTIPIVLVAPPNYERSRVKATVKTASEIQIGTIIQTVEANGDRRDLVTLTMGGVAAKGVVTPWGFIEDTAWNRAQLERDNSGQAWNKGGLYFAAGSEIEVTPFLSGMILNLMLAVGQGTIKCGTRLVAAASGLLQVHPNDLAVSTHTTGVSLITTILGVACDPSIAVLFCFATTSDAIQWIVVKIL